MQRGGTVYMFPGQGSQVVGMLKALGALTPAQRQLCELADEVLGMSLTRLMDEGPAEQLTETANAQPALLLAGLLAAQAWDVRGEAAGIVLGHSLGEYTALTHAGVLEVAEALPLVRARGELMAAAATRTPGTMAAVVRPNLQGVEEVLASCRRLGLIEIVNFNGPTQVVLSGENNALVEAVRQINAGRLGRAVALQVSAPFHTPLMQPTVDAFSQHLQRVTMAAPNCLFIDNVTGDCVKDPEQIRKNLLKQLISPVLWERGVKTAVARGADRFLECGPKRVLSALVKRIAPTAAILSSDAQ